MKYIKIVWACALVIAGHFGLMAQTSDNITVSARIVGANGKPLPQVVVSDRAGSASVTTDSEGQFQLEVPAQSVLSISAQGYVTREVAASEELGSIELDEQEGNKPVNVAFRTVAQSDLMGGVATVDVEELLTKNYYTYSLSDIQSLVAGMPGGIWGNDQYLVLVDGVPRNANSVLPVEIDQITVLKGVSAVALYGSLAAKGVVLITTKRGTTRGNTINVRANSGINTPVALPEFLGSAEYMTYYNEARVNDGLSPLYTDEEIYHHAAGTNPYRYPNVDYYSDEYLQPVFSRQDATLEISGGNERARYYTNMGFFTEGSMLDFGNAEQARNNRFNVRGNVDVDLNKNITAKVDAAVNYYTGRGVNADYWGAAANTRPHRFAPLIPISMIEPTDTETLTLINNSENIIDGQYFLGGTALDQTNAIAAVYAGGTSQYNSRQFQFNTAIDANLGNVLKGLSFSTNFGVDYATTYVLSFNNEYAVHAPVWNTYNGTDQISSLTKIGQDASSRTQNISGSAFQQNLSMTSRLNYSNTFKGNHNVTAVVSAGGFQYAISSQYHKQSSANLGLHFGYNFKNKYYAEFNGAVVHSARLPEANRRAFSPTATVAWRLSNEGFLAGSSVINDLKLSASAGILNTDMDIADYYLYEAIYRQTDGAWYTWKDGLQNQSTDSRRGANPNLTFPRREEVNVGLDVALWNNKVMLNASAFSSRMTGLVVQNAVLFPSYFVTGFPNSSFLPFVNYNEDLRTGFDYNLRLNQEVGEVGLTIGLVGTYFNTEQLRRAEIFEFSYQNRQGTPLDGIWGLENEGFFADQADIDNSATQAFGEVRPGDIKYKDQNGDGIINAQDEVLLGKGGWFGSPFTSGVNLTAKWKNFTLFALGVFRTGSMGMTTSNYFWVNGEDKYSAVVRDRWTPETSATATYPRLTTLNGNNNFRGSDFWTFSTNRFELSRVQLTYTFSEVMLGDGLFDGISVYLNGANLLMLSSNKDIMQLNVYGPPQTRFFNLGVTAQF